MRNFVCNELEPCAYLIYMAVLFFHYNYSQSFRHKVLILFYGVAAILLYAGIEITSIFNGWSYNVLFLIGICVFSWYFSSLLHNKTKRLVIYFSCAANILLLVFFDIKGNFVSDFNGAAYGVSFITIVIYTLFYFHQLLDNVQEENLLLNFDFWLICGYLLYFLGTFFIIIYYENVTNAGNRGSMWGIQNCILFLSSVITLLAYVWMHKKQKLINE